MIRRNSCTVLVCRVCLVFMAMVVSAMAQPAAEWIRRGDLLDQQNQTAPALAAYLQAEKAGPPTAALLHRIAKQYGLSMNDAPTEAAKRAAAEQALAYAQRSVKLDPKDPDAHVASAICYGRLLRFQETKVQIAWSRLIKAQAEEALRLQPDHELACYVLGAWHYEMAGLSPVKRGLARLIYGALPSASYGEAAAYFRQAIARNPERMAHHVDLGRTLIKLKDTAGAMASLRQGLALPNRDRDDPVVRARGKAALAAL